MNLEVIKEQLKQDIPEKRYLHTLGVIETAEKLAKRYQADVAKVKLAALLHDCARGFSDEELIQFAHHHDINVDYVYESFPALLHGPVGAVVAKNKYHITDEEILHAVAVHTLGDVGMGDVAKILMIADAIEPGRAYRGIEVLREQVAGCHNNINQAVLCCLEHKIQVVLKSKYLLHPLAVDARNDLLLSISK
ncbi:bis(5'-nucleosyl)-tetraphosphatase (symmetrical) YqeK [Peptococcaceae bacterium 1198_IL3148]